MEEDAALKRRADDLEAALLALQQRVLALVEILPPDALRYLHDDLGLPDKSSASLLDEWEETTSLTPTDVATEMSLLWKRLEDA
jgi:hypothetical protein